MLRIFFDYQGLLAMGLVPSRDNDTYHTIRLDGTIQVQAPTDGGDPFIKYNNAIELFTVPSRVTEVANKFIKGYGYHDNICPGHKPSREVGEYQYGTATATVDNIGSHYHVKMIGTDLEDMRTLHSLICAGKIWPIRNYASEMVPPPFRHFRQVLKELWEIFRRDVSLKHRLG